MLKNQELVLSKKVILNKNKRKVNFENVCSGCCGDYGMYVKVRGFKTDSKGKKAYSTWSKVKKVKVKRSKKSYDYRIFHYKDRKGVKKVGYCFWNDTDSRYETIYGPAINIRSAKHSRKRVFFCAKMAQN